MVLQQPLWVEEPESSCIMPSRGGYTDHSIPVTQRHTNGFLPRLEMSLQGISALPFLKAVGIVNHLIFSAASAHNSS